MRRSFNPDGIGVSEQHASLSRQLIIELASCSSYLSEGLAGVGGRKPPLKARMGCQPACFGWMVVTHGHSLLNAPWPHCIDFHVLPPKNSQLSPLPSALPAASRHKNAVPIPFPRAARGLLRSA